MPPAPAACRAACCRAPRSACSRNRAPPAVHTRHGIPRQGDRRSERPSKRREEKRREETRNGAQRERPNRNQMQMEPEGGSRACPSFDSSHAFPSKGESCTLPHLHRDSAWRLPRPGACLAQQITGCAAFPHGSAGAAVPSSRRHAVSRCAPSRGAKQNARSMGAGMVSSAARGHRDVSGIGGCKWDRGIVSGIGGL